MEISGENIQKLNQSQKNYFSSGATLALNDRIAALERFQDCIINHQDEMLEALHKDLAKPELESYLSEYHFILSELRLTCKKLSKWLKPERVSSPVFILPARSQIVYKPYGTSLIIAPWNYPFQLAFAPFIAAIAAGNTVVLKPSEKTPHSAKLIKKIVSESFTPEHASVVLGDADTSQKLLAQQWDFIFFTGSERIGKIVSEAAAKHLTPTILELGGKCPCIVDQDIDLEKTVQRILTGKFFNGGQTCVAPDYIVVHESQHDILIESLTTSLNEHPWEKEIAQIIDENGYERLLSLLSDEKTEVIIKGSDNAEKLHIAPRILPNATWEAPIMQEEIFGPILPVLTFKNHNDLIEKLNSLPSPLATYYFGRDKVIHQRIMTEIRTGGICINDIMKHLLNLELPFGGIGPSGHGHYRGRHGVRAMSHACSVARRYFIKDLFSILPPYEGRLEKLRKFVK